MRSFVLTCSYCTVSHCIKFLCLCRVMWTVHYLVHILYNPSVLYMMFYSCTTCTGAYCQRWFVVIASQGWSFCIVLYLAYEVFLIPLIPDCGLIRVLQQQLGMSAIVVPQSFIGQSGLAAAVTAVKVVGREASHWLAADQVSICDHLIGCWGISCPIGYVSAIRWDMPALWQLACVCCSYDNTMIACSQAPEDAAMALQLLWHLLWHTHLAYAHTHKTNSLQT